MNVQTKVADAGSDAAPHPNARPVPQLHALTGLRGIAAWAVVVYHARLSLLDWMPGWMIDGFGYGYLAVDIFFMLSGFVIWLNYGPKLRAAGLREAPRFWWRRFARIWPLHGAILAAMVVFALALAATGRSTANYPFAELPLHLLLVQNWGLTPELSWNHPAWSISAEAGAYLLFPLVVTLWRIERLSPVSLIAVLTLLAIGLHLAFALPGFDSLGDQITTLGLFRCVAEFGMGMVLANLWLAWRERRFALLGSAACGVVLMALGIGGWLAQTLFIPLMFAAFLLALALDRGPLARGLASRPLRWLGDVSYATYLVHFPLFILFKLLFVNDDLQVSPLGFASYCAVLLVLSGGLYHWLEKPAQRRLNALVPRQGAASSA